MYMVTGVGFAVKLRRSPLVPDRLCRRIMDKKVLPENTKWVIRFLPLIEFKSSLVLRVALCDGDFSQYDRSSVFYHPRFGSQDNRMNRRSSFA